MNLSLYLTLKQFKSGNQSGFFKTASILSIAGLSIGISALLITLFILNGFERVISEKITLLDGHIRIKHFLNEPYDPREYELENALAKESDLFSYYAYIQKPALLRKGQIAKGVIVEGISDTSYSFLSQLIISGSKNISRNGVIIGDRMSKENNLKISDNITIFDLSTFYRQEKKFKQLKVEGIFHSGIVEYDNNSIFLNLKTSQELFSMKDKISGYVFRLNSQNDMPKVRQQLEENISYPLMMMDWKEKNRALYKWLNVQRWPIVFIFGLISIVAIVNIISAISMIVVDKTRQIGLMSALGMPIKKIRQMFLIKGLVIGFFGALFGIFFALFLALLQNRFKIIKVPEDVYFMNSVPVDVSMVQIIIIFFIVIFVTATVSLWPSNRSTKISPSNALKYE